MWRRRTVIAGISEHRQITGSGKIATELRLVSCEQGEHGNHSANQRCYTVSMFRQHRLKAVHLGEEGRAAGGERGLQRMQMGGHVWFRQGHLQMQDPGSPQPHNQGKRCLL